MRAKMDPASTPQSTILEFIPVGAPFVFDEVEVEFDESDTDEAFELEEEFEPLLTGEREDAKSAVGRLDTVFHVSPDSDVVVLGLYANDLTIPSWPSMTIELVLAAKLAPRSTTGGAESVWVVLETTLTTYVPEKSSGMKANWVWTPWPLGWKMETALPCMVGKEAGLNACGVGCMKESI